MSIFLLSSAKCERLTKWNCFLHLYSDLDKRLLGVFLIFGKWPLKFWGVIWPKDSLVLGWSGQKTPWCWFSPGTKESFVQITPTPRSLLSKPPLWNRTPRSLLSKPPQHQGVFCPNHKTQKSKFQVSFSGLNIALSPNLIGSSDVDFHKDSKSGLNSKIKENTKESFAKPL